jgi:hypothetical protein
MSEIWLYNNRRIGCVLFLSSLVLLIACGAGVYLAFRGSAMLLRVIASVMLLLAGWLSVCQAIFLITPRLVFDGKNLNVHLGSRPISVPVDVVEVFFLGQGISPIQPTRGSEIVNSTVIVRLAEAASEWHHRSVDKRYGNWCDGHITIRGVWCEPLTLDVIRRLNHRLVETKRRNRANVR